MNKKIILTCEVAKKLAAYVDLTDGEISGLAKSHVEEEDIIVDDILLFKQVCSGTTTDLDDEAQALALMKMMADGENPEEWNVWWHSHVNMAVFWSGQDEKCIKDHMATHSHLVSIVTNKRGEFKSRLDIFPKDTSGFNVKLFHTIELDTEIFCEPEMTISYSDLTPEKQAELAPFFSVETLQKPLFTLEAEINPADEEIRAECVKDVAEKVTKKFPPMPYKHGVQNTGIGFQMPHEKLSKNQIKKLAKKQRKFMQRGFGQPKLLNSGYSKPGQFEDNGMLIDGDKDFDSMFDDLESNYQDEIFNKFHAK